MKYISNALCFMSPIAASVITGCTWYLTFELLALVVIVANGKESSQ